MRGPQKRKKSRGKRPTGDACTASNVCCLLAWLHMTKYGRKKLSFPVSNTHRKKKNPRLSDMLRRQIEPPYSNAPYLHSTGPVKSNITLARTPPVLNHIQTLFYTILHFTREKRHVRSFPSQHFCPRAVSALSSCLFLHN